MLIQKIQVPQHRQDSCSVMPYITQQYDDFILISIKDNGFGIKQSNYQKLFKLFGAHKNEKKKINTDGIGLGLMISRMIVDNFNGIIDFASVYKKGTIFYFSF